MKMLNILVAGIFGLSVLCPGFAMADSIADLTEVYTAEGATEEIANTASDFHGLAGAGLFNYEKNTGDGGRKNAVLPLVILTYQDWAYWSIGGGGVWLFQSGDRALKLGMGLKIHRGYTASDDDVYTGMNDRRNSLDGSVNAVWKTDGVNTSLHYYHDIGKASTGDSASLKFSYAISLSQRLRLIPNIGAEWLGMRVVDYYFGVTAAEATPIRPAYTGRDTLNYNAGLNAVYLVDKSWVLLGGMHLTYLGSGIEDSPLVSHSNSVLLYIGADWRF